ncbi:hypothetical protein HOK31_28255 [Candidatus Poribacteria bacterium]|nr:hypothetical protein [Candidatus Poribacteria bacterium]
MELTHPTLASLVTTSDGIPYSTHEVYVDHWYPRWSPDGTQIAFTSDRDAVFHFDKTTGGFAHESTGIYVVGLSETVAGVRSGGHGLTMWGKVKSP